MEVVWQVEKDEWCSRVLSKHWPDTPRWGDIEDFLADAAIERRNRGQRLYDRTEEGDGLYVSSKVREVDLICGGFPCQPVSYAGKRKGKDDARWLWPKFADTVRLFRPRYVLAENVPGLLTNGGVGVIEDLAALGYDCEWDCIPAAAVGAPHLRYRVFIVAHSPSQRLEGRDNGQRRQQEESQRLLLARSSERSQLADAAHSLRGQNRASKASVEGDGKLPRRIFSGAPTRDDWWAVEPDIRRVVDGVPSRVHRLRGLGNAVVPQVAEWVGERIMEFERTA